MRVLVTRAAEDALGFCQALEAAGHRPVQVPLIERVWEVDAVAAFAHAHPQADWVILTSATGAEVMGAGAPGAWAEARIAAVGPTTARALLALGRPAQVVPREHTAVGLVDAMPDLTGSTVILPRADLSPPDLARALTARGARVLDVIAYRNRAPAGHQDRVRAALPVDATPLLSGSAATRLALALDGKGYERLGRVLAVGPSTARIARQVGLPVHGVADRYTAEGLLALLGT